MQKKKHEILALIIEHSFIEFKEKGFSKASMRNIAGKSKVSLANIYNYFSSKDELFKEVLKPTLVIVKSCLIFIKPQNYPDIFNCVLNEHLRFINIIAEFVEQNRDLLNILIFKSAGSSLENFKDSIIEEYTDICLEYCKIISFHVTGAEHTISRFVAHNIAGMWANFITESLMHNLSHDQIIITGREMMVFMYNGWNSLIKI